MEVGMGPTRLLELKSMRESDLHAPMSAGIVPVMFASEITSFSRCRKTEKFASN